MANPSLTKLMAEARVDELRVEAARSVAHAAIPSGRTADEAGSAAEVVITLRLAGPADGRALARLAGLDSARVPAAPVLLAEADGAIRAALSLHDDAMIADPFHRTASARELLLARAAQLRGERRRGRRVSRRLRLIGGVRAPAAADRR